MSVKWPQTPFVGALALTFALASCGGPKSEPVPSPRTSAAGPRAMVETNNINMYIDAIVPGAETTRVKGWAFIGGKDAVGSETFVVLRGNNAQAEYPASRVPRADVAAAYKHPGMIDSGFTVDVPNKSLPPGEYQIGIRIQRAGEDALQFTPKKVTLR